MPLGGGIDREGPRYTDGDGLHAGSRVSGPSAHTVGLPGRPHAQGTLMEGFALAGRPGTPHDYRCRWSSGTMHNLSDFSAHRLASWSATDKAKIQDGQPGTPAAIDKHY
jgi:hypothetical protein